MTANGAASKAAATTASVTAVLADASSGAASNASSNAATRASRGSTGEKNKAFGRRTRNPSPGTTDTIADDDWCERLGRHGTPPRRRAKAVASSGPRARRTDVTR